ncbi:phosphotransferase [Oscillibacter valericigenes]|uniref:phosphotransferase enzyme family protein n=1 Tax=Oscillibacter valericigenes TaxID=351091 RepID=UPI001F3774C5|nr:phosphotransferase [Oscillibacter valericigenes]MCF2617596.1 phosphotransferase [Oscillibacter valericigenes]
MEIDEKLKKIGEAFRIEGTYMGHEQIKVGNVNQTYKVVYRQPDGSPKYYIVQRVNTYAFRQPEELMHNADLITEHIRAKKQSGVALHFHHTRDRKTYVYDGEHGFWRLTNYIPSVTYSGTSDPEVLRRTGEAFGAFRRQLSDFPVTDLYETIPNFHNTPKRMEALFADAALDPVGRAGEAKEDLSYLASVREEAETLTRLYEAGKLPLRVTHNDTKINNVLFNRQTDEAMLTPPTAYAVGFQST